MEPPLMFCSKKKSKFEREAERLQREIDLLTETNKLYRELLKRLKQDVEFAELVHARPGKRG